MEKNTFKERCEVRMAALGLGQKEIGELVSKPQQRINEAVRGDKTPAASSLRVAIDQAITKKVDEKRKQMIEDAKPHLAEQADLDPWAVSMILPEDMQYIVTHYGIPVGTYNPVTKKYQAF